MQGWKLILLPSLFMIALTGCASMAIESAPTQALVTITMLPTMTPFTPLTDTPTPSPTVTETPTETATATPEPTLTATETTTATPEPTATETPVPTETPIQQPVVLVGAGDISFCGEEWLGDENTAEVLARVIEEHPDATIFTAGDNVQVDGAWAEFENCFAPTWGRFKDRIRPAPGNHDYITDSGGPYYTYFGAAAGEPGLGFYSYDLGDWHIVSLNSNCDYVACRDDSSQAAWLREDLQNNNKRCTLLYWHHPLFTSGTTGSNRFTRTFWQIGEEFGVEMIVNGHDHSYERFAPQDHGGNATPDGIRQFVVGTGGAFFHGLGEILPNSEVYNNDDHGVIQFMLYPDRYEWEFIPVVGGDFIDSGSGACH